MRPLGRRRALAAALLVLCGLGTEPVGARRKGSKAKRGAKAPAAASSAIAGTDTPSHGVLEALGRCRAGDQAGARELAQRALAAYQRRGPEQPSLEPLLATAETAVGLQLALQHFVLPAMEIPAPVAGRLVGSGQILEHLDKGPFGSFLVRFAAPLTLQPDPSYRARQLAKLEWKELLARAKRSGVSQDAIDDAMDAECAPPLPPRPVTATSCHGRSVPRVAQPLRRCAAN